MQCPQCRTGLINLSEKCPSCSYIFGIETRRRLSLYFGIKGDVEQIQTLVKNELWVKLKDVAGRMEQLDVLMNADMQARAGADTGRMPAAATPPAAETVADGYGIADEGPVSAPVERPAVVPPARQAQAAKITVPPREPESSGFEAKIGQKWLLIIGIVTMVFGVGYFLKYSFEQGWVGPAGRVAMAYVWGIVMLVAGDLFRRRNLETFGLYMIGGGIAILYASTFAAFQLYHLFDQMPSFGVMIMITVLAGALAIVYDTKWLAVLGLIGGFLTPVLLSTGQDNQVGLMTYMTILNAGLLGIAIYKKWDLLNILGFVFTYLLYSLWYFSHYSSDKFWPSMIFLNIFYLIYSIMPFAYQFVRSAREKFEGFLIITPNSFIAFGYSYVMIREYAGLEWVSVASVSYAVIFLAMATYLVRTGRQDAEAFTVLLAKAALFLIITVPMIVSQHWITIFWAAQAAVLLWMGVRLQQRGLSAGAYILLAVAIGKFLMHDYEAVFHFRHWYGDLSRSYTYLIAERFATTFVLLSITGWFAVSVHRSAIVLLTKGGSDAGFFSALTGILLFIVLNVETAAFFHDYLPAARFAAVSVLWALFSSVMIVAGFKRNSALLRKVSLSLFAVTLVKVFLFDMSNVSTPYRIISFIILGLMLVAASYLYYRFRDKISESLGG